MKHIITHKQLIFRLISVIILSIYSPTIFAQIFDDDQNPPSVKWRQIQTENFQIIYPEEFEARAQHVAFVTESVIEKVSHSIGTKPRKISIILQTRDVVSNGFVQLAPRRSEFSTTPPQQMDFQDWVNSLAVHELRHVVQFDRLAGYLGPPLFEQLALAIFGITLPPWFYEGDAVGIETSLTTAGRGRLPSWELIFRTNTLSGKKYSYQKDFLGSYKNLTPGYYQLGYFMTTKMRRDYGEHFLDSLFTRMAKNPIRPYNFSNTLKHFTGHNTESWHRETVSELERLWHAQLAQNHPQDYSLFPQPKADEIIDFLLPKRMPNGSLLALQKSNRQVSKIIRIYPDGSIHEVVKTGLQNPAHFSYGGGKITWDELRYNGRFLKQTFQVIHLYDLNTRRHTQISRKTRLFSPALSADGNLIAAIEIGLDNRSFLQILDSRSGQLRQRIALPRALNAQTPSFDPSGNKVVCTVLHQGGANLLEVNLETEQSTLLLDWQAQQLERPIYSPKGIIFKAHFNGIDNLYLLPQDGGEIQALTNIRYGAFNPSYSPEDGRIYFNNYQVNGQLISSVDPDSTTLVPITQTPDSFISYFKPLIRQEAPTDTSDFNENKIFDSSPYKDVAHLFNFHSISPVGDDISSVDNFDLGLQLMSDNLLNTFSTAAGFHYNQNIHRMDYFASMAFKRWLPKISLDYRNQAQLSSLVIRNLSDQRIPLRWREHEVELKATIPLLFNRLNTVYNTGITVGTSYTWRYDISLKNATIPNFDQVRFPLVAQYYFNRNSLRSPLDLAPRWGQNFNFIYRGMTFDNRLSGNMYSLKTTLYFPGLVTNHSFQLRFNFQERFGDYRLTNDIPYVSGYDQLAPTRVNNTLFADYKFPIAYPDWNISPLAFIKRIRGGLFADFENFGQHQQVAPRVFGIELRSDLNLLRFYLPNFDAGIRAICVNEPNPRKVIFTYGVTYTY